jgi:hypothetical protein
MEYIGKSGRKYNSKPMVSANTVVDNTSGIVITKNSVDTERTGHNSFFMKWENSFYAVDNIKAFLEHFKLFNTEVIVTGDYPSAQEIAQDITGQ